jgi:hypothetical protein
LLFFYGTELYFSSVGSDRSFYRALASSEDSTKETIGSTKVVPSISTIFSSSFLFSSTSSSSSTSAFNAGGAYALFLHYYTSTINLSYFVLISSLMSSTSKIFFLSKSSSKYFWSSFELLSSCWSSPSRSFYQSVSKGAVEGAEESFCFFLFFLFFFFFLFFCSPSSTTFSL